MRKAQSIFVVVVVSLSCSAVAQDRQEARHAAVQAIQSMIHSSGDDPLQKFMNEQLSESYRQSMAPKEMLDHLQKIRDAAAGATGLDLDMSPEGLRLMLSGAREATILVGFDPEPPYKIGELALEEGHARRAQSEDEAAMVQRVRALESLGQGGGDAALERFIEEHLAESYRDSLPREELLDLLRSIRLAMAGAGGIQVQVMTGGVEILLRGSRSSRVTFQIDPQAPHKITSLAIDELAEEAGNNKSRLEWSRLEQRLAEAERDGFSGALIVVRDGKTIVDRGFGLADREQKIPNSTETLFGIGSVPIDFTKAAILKLEELGKLSAADPIERYLPGVPEDKRTITVDHLMTGRSGLPNFHHVPEVDKDYDLSWIDRETAIQRILGQELMFAPGEEESHSHSAWGLLAAIVEIVSRQSYGEFLRQHFFGPAGMARTGFYGEDRFDDPEYAVGYGPSSIAPRNSPNHWGPTSWLVMGSGGMFSTPADLHRWVTGMRSGKLLSPESQKRFWTGSALAGASDRGFLCVYTDGPDTMMFLSSNAMFGEDGPAQRLAEDLAGLVLEE